MLQGLKGRNQLDVPYGIINKYYLFMFMGRFVTIEVKGEKESEAQILKLEGMMRAIWLVIREFAIKMVNQIKRNATTNPTVKSGLLRRSSLWKRIGATAVRIFNPVEYASFQDTGTRFIKPTWFFTAGIRRFIGPLTKAINKVMEDFAKD